MGSRLIPFIGLSAIFLFAIIPQAQADLCGDTIEVQINDAAGNSIFSDSGLVDPLDEFFVTIFSIDSEVDISIFVFCDGGFGDPIDGTSVIIWDYDSFGNSPINIPEHSFWFNDLEWTDVSGQVTAFEVSGSINETPSLMTTGFSANSAHAIVGAFTIDPFGTLQNELLLTATHPVGGMGLPIDTTALLLASAQSVSLWMLPIIASGIAVGVFIIKKRS